MGLSLSLRPGTSSGAARHLPQRGKASAPSFPQCYAAMGGKESESGLRYCLPPLGKVSGHLKGLTEEVFCAEVAQLPCHGPQSVSPSGDLFRRCAPPSPQSPGGCRNRYSTYPQSPGGSSGPRPEKSPLGKVTPKGSEEVLGAGSAYLACQGSKSVSPSGDLFRRCAPPSPTGEGFSLVLPAALCSDVRNVDGAGPALKPCPVRRVMLLQTAPLYDCQPNSVLPLIPVMK